MLNDPVISNTSRLADIRAAASMPSPNLQVLAHRAGPGFQFGTVKDFEFSEVVIPINDLPPILEGLRIAHLSDLHIRRRWEPGYDRLIAQLRDDTPDLLLFTGDFLEDKNDQRPGLPILQRLIPQLKSRLGFYAILGNHDSEIATPALRELPMTLVDAGWARLTHHDATIEIIGLLSMSRSDIEPTFLRNLGQPKPGELRIAMCHYPDGLIDARGLTAHLFLAGHTHGGQVCLPGGIPITLHDGLPRRLGQGIHKIGPTWLVVSRGFGFAGPPIRTFCPPQLVYLHLKRSLIPSPGTPDFGELRRAGEG